MPESLYVSFCHRSRPCWKCAVIQHRSHLGVDRGLILNLSVRRFASAKPLVLLLLRQCLMSSIFRPQGS
jgi:hypothetical protein